MRKGRERDLTELYSCKGERRGDALYSNIDHFFRKERIASIEDLLDGAVRDTTLDPDLLPRAVLIVQRAVRMVRVAKLRRRS